MLVLEVPESLEKRLRSVAEIKNHSVSDEVIGTLLGAYSIPADETTIPKLYELNLSSLKAQLHPENIQRDLQSLLDQVLELQELLPIAYKKIEQLTKENEELEEKIRSCCEHNLMS